MEESLDLTFTIKNDQVTSKRCVLFGGNRMLDVNQYGSQQGITITPSYRVSYIQVLREAILFPFEIGNIRMQSVENPAQVTTGILVQTVGMYGDDTTEAISMVGVVNEYQEQLGIANLKKNIIITGDVYLQFQVLPSTTLICTVSFKRKINGNRLLHSLSPLVNYKQGGTSIKPLYVPVNPLQLKN